MLIQIQTNFLDRPPFSVLVQREMETEGSFVSGLGYVILGSFYGFTASGASSPYGFLFSGSVSGRDAETVGQVDCGLA